MNLKNLKYPLYLFLIVLFAKIGYVVVESYYNYHVLTVTTSAEVSRDTIEELNINGHRISAIGITLLLLPFLYIIVKRFDKIKMLILLSVLTLLTYTLSYQSLNIIVDKIVENNKEKRHDAYYVNVFKYGVLNNIFVYNSFVDSTKVQNNSIEVNDRILLTNSFLLLHADKNLINKLKERGKDKVADLYIQRELSDDYEKKFKSFKNASTDISKLWNEFNNNRNKLDIKIKELEDEQIIKDSYKEFTDSLKQSFANYQNGWNKLNLQIREETQVYKIKNIKNYLEKYFRYQQYRSTQVKYHEKMISTFGQYIEPKRWKDKKEKLTFNSVKRVVIEEIIKKPKEQMNNLPKELSVKEFMYHDNTKLAVNKQLEKKNILIPYDFDYSYKQFKQYFDVMITKKQIATYNTFYKELEKNIGKNDLNLSMEWKDFVYSQYIQNSIQSKVEDMNIDNTLKAIESKDLSNFKKLVYLPTVIDKVNEMMYKEVDFKDEGKAMAHGDDSIKLLYIPPFALAVSIVALLLNIITILVMLLSMTNISNNIKLSIKSAIILAIISLPLIISHNSLDNSMIQKSIKGETQIYLNFLSWISYYEKVNSNVHN